jgi:hypothetical protein
VKFVKYKIKDLSSVQYFKPEFLPQINFVTKNCQSIVFVYAYLLSYCMGGEFTSFKEKYTITVLKNCIILGFQYYHFMSEVISYYFKNLILKRS